MALLGFWQDICRIRQGGKGVFCGKAGNVVSRLYRLADGSLRKIRGTGATTAGF